MMYLHIYILKSSFPKRDERHSKERGLTMPMPTIIIIACAYITIHCMAVLRVDYFTPPVDILVCISVLQDSVPVFYLWIYYRATMPYPCTLHIDYCTLLVHILQYIT